MEFFKPGRQFDFMGQRKFWITLSFSLVIISTILSSAAPFHDVDGKVQYNDELNAHNGIVGRRG